MRFVPIGRQLDRHAREIWYPLLFQNFNPPSSPVVWVSRDVLSFPLKPKSYSKCNQLVDKGILIKIKLLTEKYPMRHIVFDGRC